jgi:isoquinoline 1-oxidoreductase alpha subunit
LNNAILSAAARWDYDGLRQAGIHPPPGLSLALAGVTGALRVSVRLDVNGRALETDAEPDTPLLWVLRDHLGLTGTKFGCGIAQCGACTVHLDGGATRSCQVPLSAVTNTGVKITTIEALSIDGNHPLQKVWVEANVPQCGYCQAGMLMAAAALLNDNPNPSDADIDAQVSNICRCGTYPRVRAAIHEAAAMLRESPRA